MAANYEYGLAQWVNSARMDPKKPIEVAITSLKKARKLLIEVTLENRHDNLKNVGKVFDEATVLFDPPMTVVIIQTLRPVCSEFDAALRAYVYAARQQHGLFMKRDQVTQQELAIFKHNAGRSIDKLIKWYELLPTA